MKKIPVKLIEDHDEAYYFWKKCGLLSRPLIHIDAHMDFNFFPARPPIQALREAKSKKDLIRQLSVNFAYKQLGITEKSLTNIGNYIFPAMRDGIISDLYWVIPGDNREFNRSVKMIRDMIRSFFLNDPFEKRKITRGRCMLKAKIYNRNFTISNLDGLPEKIRGPILDIDTDFFTTETIGESGIGDNIGNRFPWIWPDMLVSKLKSKKIKPSCVTVAYSVNGGFTPIIYKFLGDETLLHLNGADKKLQDFISNKNKALTFLKTGKRKKAVYTLRRLLDDSGAIRLKAVFKNRLKAHLAFLLFRYYAKAKDFAKARLYYRYAVRHDNTYRAKDNNYGYLYMIKGKSLKKAELEFGAVLSADKTNTRALSGLASVFFMRKDYKKAKSYFKKSRDIDKNNKEALLGLAKSELFLKNYKAALRVLRGYKPKGVGQGAASKMLARAYEGLGRLDEALDAYRIALYFYSDLNLYLSLFKLVKKRGIPKKHKDWIEKRVNTYKDYKENIFNQKEKFLRKPKTKPEIETVRLLRRIDSLLEGIYKDKE